MGYAPHNIHFTEENIKKVFPDPKGLKILELGDQEIRYLDDFIYSFPDQGEIEHRKSAKDYFIEQGYDHTSVDLKGLRGSEIRDLRNPEEFLDWHDTFDILTNSGTTEHVEPRDSQYECFSIIHDVVKVGGIFVHILPDADQMLKYGYWADHCNIYYNSIFFEELAYLCEYKILVNKVSTGNRAVVMQKTDAPFTTDRSITELLYLNLT